MTKKIFLSIIALLLITCTLALCLASCDDVIVINLEDDDIDKDDEEDEEETKKNKETTGKDDEDPKESDDKLNSESDENAYPDSDEKADPESDEKADPESDEEGDYVAPDTEENSRVAIPGWAEITMPPNQIENIVVDFYNPEENKDKYYLTFNLYINNEDGTKDIIYESQLIPPGQHIQRITLYHALAEGEYDATMYVQAYNMKGVLLSNKKLDSKLKLIVK